MKVYITINIFDIICEIIFFLDDEGGKIVTNAPVPIPVMGVAGEIISPTSCNRDFPNQPDSISIADSSELAASSPIYFRSFTFSPDVLIRFDYHGKGVDLSQGPSFSGLLVGLGQLNCSQLTLKRLSHRHGYNNKYYVLLIAPLLTFLKCLIGSWGLIN